MRIIYQSSDIIIREFLPEEQVLFTSLFEDEEVIRHLPRRTREQYVEIFQASLTAYGNSPFSRWGIFTAAGSGFAGMCLIREFADVPGQVELGYSLGRSYWGRGIATECVRALTAYGFAGTDTAEMVAVTTLENIGSQKALLKGGFTQQQNLKRAEEELAYFLLSRAEYEEGKA
ncbi:GNAT family N-acetyltransferase [Chitinophaga solisilvae]|uniref:GNAT family N-acetyltransferase n=1 Tax=Chitinophaga solisilvae TaxID=1233460 RepID=UPI0013722A2A|nr:GNAT family N-acetyltransferase [Chitinophaga solisilvae]